MSELLPKGTKVIARLWDCGTDGRTCDGHKATVIDVDPDDPTLPYQVRYDDDDPHGPGHETWAESTEVTPA